jgi:signal transduction histidine kinase
VTGFGKTLTIKDGKLKLTNNINEVRFNIQTVHWANPKSLNLYYRIDDTLAFIPYNELSRVNVLVEEPGYHNLQFLYIDDNGKETVVLTIRIEKENPWYFQTSYLFLFIVFMVITISFITWLKTRNAEIKNRKLVEIIREKTHEITEINGQLMAKVAELTQLNKINGIYISVINHDIFAPIKYINVVGDKVHEYQKKLKKADILNHLELIINSTKRLEILCSNILNERSSGKSFTTVQPKIPLHSIVADLQSFVKIGLQINNNEMISKVPVKATASTSQSALNIILTNLISNANRFTKNGTISVHYHKKEDLHCIEVKDTGNGMQPDVLEKIQNRTLQVHHKDSSELQSYGIGYSLIFKMLDIINGDMKVTSTPLKGTSVTIIFPDLPA